MHPPILFFAFNRPNHTKLSLNSLITNKECLNSAFFAFVDGPRNSKDKKKIDDVIKIIKSYKENFKSFKLNISKKNNGCAGQVLSNIPFIFQTYDSLIYLEDDIIVSQHFLSFMHQNLLKYREIHQIKSISGFSLPAFTNKKHPFFLHTFFTWGFGIWKRSWNEFEYNKENLIVELKQKNLLSKFTYNFSNYNLDSYKKYLKGVKGAWDVRLLASMLLNNGLTLTPHRSLTKNIGTDSSGTNFSFSTKKYNVVLHQDPITSFPEKIKESEDAYNDLVAFYKSHKLSIWGHIKSKTKKMLKLLN